MKEKFKKMVASLAHKHYSVNMIQRCILLPLQVEKTEELLDLLIIAIENTNDEITLEKEIVKLENKYIEN